ncbi:MAG: hypothetical protein LBD71_02165 [Treponema sp.]|nr:hypothetical protein [Treponema sp.]
MKNERVKTGNLPGTTPKTKAHYAWFGRFVGIAFTDHPAAAMAFDGAKTKPSRKNGAVMPQNKTGPKKRG